MRTIRWINSKVVTIDQNQLPDETRFLELETYKDVADAINSMKIRGAPLIGAAAAYGLALVAYHSKAKSKHELINELQVAAEVLRRTRPTAINLFWAIDRMNQKASTFAGNLPEIRSLIVAEAQKIADEDAEANHAIGQFGSALLENGDVVLTHCNAGALATVDYGTALGVVRHAWETGKDISVIATETRPKLQGARLTVYELKGEGIPVTLITDNMVGYIMSQRLVSKVIVGADRIVKDAVINKIGTYTIAVLARAHSIPFYVAAPKSTFDLKRSSSEIIIEERSKEEVSHIKSIRILSDDVNILNPAFDITPLEYVSAIICEEGLFRNGNLDKIYK